LCWRCLATNKSCAKAWEFLGIVKEKEAAYKEAKRAEMDRAAELKAHEAKEMEKAWKAARDEAERAAKAVADMSASIAQEKEDQQRARSSIRAQQDKEDVYASLIKKRDEDDEIQQNQQRDDEEADEEEDKRKKRLAAEAAETEREARDSKEDNDLVQLRSKSEHAAALKAWGKAMIKQFNEQLLQLEAIEGDAVEEAEQDAEKDARMKSRRTKRLKSGMPAGMGKADDDETELEGSLKQNQQAAQQAATHVAAPAQQQQQQQQTQTHPQPQKHLGFYADGAAELEKEKMEAGESAADVAMQKAIRELDAQGDEQNGSAAAKLREMTTALDAMQSTLTTEDDAPDVKIGNVDLHLAL